MHIQASSLSTSYSDGWAYQFRIDTCDTCNSNDVAHWTAGAFITFMLIAITSR